VSLRFRVLDNSLFEVLVKRFHQEVARCFPLLEVLRLKFGGILAILRCLVLDGRLFDIFSKLVNSEVSPLFPERKLSFLTLSGILSMDTSVVVVERWKRSFLFFCRILMFDALRFAFMSKSVNNHVRARFGVLKAFHWDMIRNPFHPEMSRRSRPLTPSF
jgi:hypothetical protein